MLVAIRNVAHTDHASAKVTASIGLTTCTTQQRFPALAAFLESADHALYAAKLRGRDRLESFEELADATRQTVSR
jgi:PleD family two-component response regulator